MGVDLAAGGEPGCPRQVPIVRAGPADIETLGLVSTLGYIDESAAPRDRVSASPSGMGSAPLIIRSSRACTVAAALIAGDRWPARGRSRTVRSIARSTSIPACGTRWPTTPRVSASTMRMRPPTPCRGAAGRGPQGRPHRCRREPRRADRVLRDPGRGACASTRARCHCSIRTRGLQPHRRSVRCPSTRKTVHYWWSLNIHFFPRAMQTGVADGRNRNSDSLPFRPGRPGVEWVSRTPNLRRPATATHQHMPSCQPVARGGLPGTAQPAETTQPTGRCLRRTPPVPGDQPGMIVDERARAVGPSRPHDLVGRQSGQR